MKNLEHLPEKIAFKLDDLGKKWIRETFETDYYEDYDDKDYFHYPNRENYNGFLKGKHYHFSIIDGYTLITTDQLFNEVNFQTINSLEEYLDSQNISLKPIIPTIEKGVIMLVWNAVEEDAVEREVMFFDGYLYHTKTIGSIYLSGYKNAKPTLSLPEYTLEQLKEIVGHEFKIKQ